MYYVYAIQSLKDNRIYVGLSNDYNRRIREHNSGYVKPTKPYRPWTLIYSEECGERKNARLREKYLKSGCGKEFLKQNYSRVPACRQAGRSDSALYSRGIT